MTKVVLIQRLFAIYRKPIYDLLSKKINFRLLTNTSSEGIAVASASYSYPIKKVVYGKGENKMFLFSFLPVLKFRPQVIIHEFAIGILSLPIMWFFSKMIRSKFILYSHGYNRKLGFNPKHNFADKYRLWFMNQADAIILYGEMDRQLLEQYINHEKIFVAQNTLDTNTLTKMRDSLEEKGCLLVRKDLNWKLGYHLTFIGRLLEDKHPELLIDVLCILKEYSPVPIFIHYIGDGPFIDVIKNKSKNLGLTDSVFFYGAMYDDYKIGEILYASDLMIMPGYLGLSINHAFCFDCPVISFSQKDNGPFHSPEVEYVIDGETGYLVNEQSVEALTKVVYNYLIDVDLQKDMKNKIRNMVKNVFPPEKMVQGILDAVNYSLTH